MAESSGGRPFFGATAQMPLAGHERGIAGFFEEFGDRGGCFGKVVLVGRGVGDGALVGVIVVDHGADADLPRIAAGHDGRAGRAATGSVVEGAEFDALGGEVVEVGRLDFGAVAGGSE